MCAQQLPRGWGIEDATAWLHTARAKAGGGNGSAQVHLSWLCARCSPACRPSCVWQRNIVATPHVARVLARRPAAVTVLLATPSVCLRAAARGYDNKRMAHAAGVRHAAGAEAANSQRSVPSRMCAQAVMITEPG